MEKIITKNRFFNVVGIVLFVFAFYNEASAKFSPEQKVLFEKTTHDFFQTSRGKDILNRCLTSYQALYLKVKDEPSLNINYAYALYYEASYVFPKKTEDDDWNSSNKKLIAQYAPLREKAYRLAISLTESATNMKIDSKPILAEAYFTYGLAAGELAELVRSMFLIIKARNCFLKALDLYPDVRGGALYLGLGRMYDRTPGILFGNKKKSLEFLNLAISRFNPPNIVAFYYKAELLMNGKKPENIKDPKRQEIIDCLKKGLAIGARKRNTPEELDGIFYMKKILAEFTG